MTRIKPLIGAVGTPTPASLAASLEKAGFVVLDSRNVSINGLQAPLIERADGFFRTLKKVVLGGVKVGLLPGHFRTLFERLTRDCDAFVEADRQGLCTTSWRWLAEKPRVVTEADAVGLGVVGLEVAAATTTGQGEKAAAVEGNGDSAYASLSSSQEAVDRQGEKKAGVAGTEMVSGVANGKQAVR